MLCLTIRQPYVAMLLTGEKPYEYRSWVTSHRGLLLLHSAARRDPDAPLSLGHLDAPLGCIVAVADLRAVERLTRTRAALLDKPDGRVWEGLFAWHLHIVERFAHPIPWRGRLGLYDVPAQMLQRGRNEREGQKRSPSLSDPQRRIVRCI